MGRRLTQADVQFSHNQGGVAGGYKPHVFWYVVGRALVWHSTANHTTCCETCRSTTCRHVPVAEEAIGQRGIYLNGETR
jgi:hypothetical protein